MKMRAGNLGFFLVGWLAFFLLLGGAASLEAAPWRFPLTKVKPENAEIRLYHSFQEKLVLLALVQKNAGIFDCEPNRYLFYDYDKERFFELTGGHLVLSKSLQGAFLTKVHQVGGAEVQQNLQSWRQQIEQVLQELNITPKVMEASKTSDGANRVGCWQQPVWVDLQHLTQKSYPYLVENNCDHLFCPQMDFLSETKVRFLSRIQEGENRQVDLDLKRGVITNRGPAQKPKRGGQPDLEHMPRANLYKAAKEGRQKLSSAGGKDLYLGWETSASGRLHFYLERAKPDAAAANRILEEASRRVEKKEIPQAIEAMKFGLWLEPESFNLRYQRLRAWGGLLMFKELFESLNADFKEPERVKACGQIHLDPAFARYWENPLWTKGFEISCKI